MSHTFVTCFIDLNRFENRDGVRDKLFYLKLGTKLLKYSFPNNFVVFIEKESMSDLERLLSEENIDCSNIKLVSVEEPLPVYGILNKDLVTLPDIRTPRKDTYNYMALMISKTHFIEEAIRLNYFCSGMYSWIDFGIMHMIKDPDLFGQNLMEISNYKNIKIKIAGCFRNWDDRKLRFLEKYPKINWLFAGCFFSGNTKKLLEFCSLVNESLYVLKYFKFITWEINIWAEIYYKNVELFDWYYANHGDEIFSNFIQQ
jgi:hypothetical protein